LVFSCFGFNGCFGFNSCCSCHLHV
jgi:hypothetical protein